MAQSPEIQFTQSGNAHIAYQVLGSGPLDILAFSSAVLPIDSMDEEPLLARFHRRLASFGRLIRFDARGVGLSDPVVDASPAILEHWVEDAVAVLDEVGSKRAAVLAPRDASLRGVLLAATFPERVASLVFINGTARMARADDYPVGIPQPILERFLEVNMDPHAVEQGFDFLASAAPSVVGDETFRAWWVKAGYRGASPATARAVQAVYLRADVRALLPSVQAPTLILHRRANEIVRVGHGQYLAEHIPGAHYVELDGADDLYWVGDTETMLDEIEEFLTGVRRGAGADRTLTTILFSDIVGSTATAADLGDRQWRDLLEQHDMLIRRQLVRFGGHEVNTTGDGVVATFDGPARAVTCAGAMRGAAAQLGIELRVGIHTGEVEKRGDDLAGLAVHIAARVEALAEPGQVLVSRTVVDLVVGSAIKFADRGEHVLKGVPGTWHLFSVET
jgi:class 3 adenylate cyclase